MMYNDALIKAIISKHGIEATEKYCKIRVDVLEIQYKNFRPYDEEAVEILRERDFWEYAEQQLREEINKKHKT